MSAGGATDCGFEWTVRRPAVAPMPKGYDVGVQYDHND